MNVIMDLTRTILQTEFERFLPDGAGISLPVPTRRGEEAGVGVFVYSAHDGTASAPRGVFFLSTDCSRVLAYDPLPPDGVRSAALPALPAPEARAQLEIISRLLPEVTARFADGAADTAARQTGADYLAALEVIAGDAAQFYRACFPAFFGWVRS